MLPVAKGLTYLFYFSLVRAISCFSAILTLTPLRWVIHYINTIKCGTVSKELIVFEVEAKILLFTSDERFLAMGKSAHQIICCSSRSCDPRRIRSPYHIRVTLLY